MRRDEPNEAGYWFALVRLHGKNPRKGIYSSNAQLKVAKRTPRG